MNRIGNSKKEFAYQAILCIIVALIAFSMVYPFYYCLVQSFNDGYDAMMGGVYWFPRQFTLNNYRTVFVNPNILQTFATTVLRTIAGTVTSLLFTAMFAYGLSKKVMYRRLYSVLGLVTMYFGGGLIPTYLLIKSLGMIDSFLVYIIPGIFSFYNALLFIANFRAIPESVEESALIDGARPIHIFFRIIMPLSTPIIATIALFNGVGHWNDWFTTAIYTKSAWLNTLPMLLKDIINFAANQEDISQKLRVERTNVTIEALRFATMMLAVIPITVSYPFLQKYFVKGMMIGAVKA